MSALPATTRTVYLDAPPFAAPRPDRFAVVETELPRLIPGTALVENIYLAADTYPMECTACPCAVRQPLRSAQAIGRVVASRTAALRTGSLVAHGEGWSAHTVVAPGQYMVRRIEPAQGVPLSAYLSILGLPGLAAYVGVTQLLRLEPGETVHISPVADPVGVAAAQIARLQGAGRVVGGVGEGCAPMAEHIAERLDLDGVLEYDAAPIDEQLGCLTPGGVDAAFIALDCGRTVSALRGTRQTGRAAWNRAVERDGCAREDCVVSRELAAMRARGLWLKAFELRHHLHLREQAEAWLTPYAVSGRIAAHDTVVRGFEELPAAFCRAAAGEHLGQTVVQIADL